MSTNYQNTKKHQFNKTSSKKSNKIKANITKKLIIIAFLIVLITIATVITITTQQPKLVLKSNDIDVIEYGETYNANLQNLLSFKDLSETQIKQITNKCQITSNISNEKGKNYPAVGLYKVYLNYGKQVVCKKVEVKDTTPPNLILNKSNFEILQDTIVDLYDFGVFYDAKDKSVTMTYLDTSKINSKKPGYYKMQVISKDSCGNETIKDVTVKVKEKQTVKNNSNNSNNSNNTNNELNSENISNDSNSSSNTNNSQNYQDSQDNQNSQNSQDTQENNLSNTITN